MKINRTMLGGMALVCLVLAVWGWQVQRPVQKNVGANPAASSGSHAGPPANVGISFGGAPAPGKVSSSMKVSGAAGNVPVKPYAMADMGRRDYLKNAQWISHRDSPSDATGHFHRISLYRTNMKYPLIRVEDILGPGPTGNQVIVAETAAVADHIIVRLQPGSDEGELKRLAGQNGASLVKTPQAGLYLVQLPQATMDTLSEAIQTYGQYKGLLKYAEADSLVHTAVVPNDPSFAGEWGLNNTGQTAGTPHADIEAESAWGIINQSPNVVVAVIDTGIDFNHPDLAANIWTNPNPGAYGYANDLHGWNFYAGTNSPQDDNFHGTHVSGTIGAVGNNGIGVAGTTWKVKIVPLKFLDDTGSGFTSDAVNAIYYATAIHANIMSNSWGGSGYSQALKDAIDSANAAGILFVAAAGNDGTDTDTNPTYPADFTSSNIISVAATDDTDHLASFSNYGTSTVELAAPGVGVLSTFPTVATAAMISEGLPTNYGQISGTSMATPHVSGVAALALAQNPNLTVGLLRAQLLARVTQLPQLVGVVQTAGRLDAYNVVNTSWQPAGVQVQTLSVATVSEGTGTSIANPGAIIDFTPTILNAGGVAATNVTASLVSNQTTATVLTSAIDQGTVAPFARANPGPFRVQLSNALTDKTALTFDVVVTADGVTAIHTPVTVIISAPQPGSEAAVAFACGEIKADPSRNLVYVTDTTNDRVFAIDTGLGQVAASTPLDATPGPNPPPMGQANQIGQMAVSLDGTRLYVALSSQQEIEVFSLPSLSSLTTVRPTS
jgi:subtilisin family serine protease